MIVPHCKLWVCIIGCDVPALIFGHRPTLCLTKCDYLSCYNFDVRELILIVLAGFVVVEKVSSQKMLFPPHLRLFLGTSLE